MSSIASTEPAQKKRKLNENKMAAQVVKSWVPSANDAECEFPLQNLPYGVFSTSGTTGRVGVAIGDQILDLSVAVAVGVVSEPEGAEGAFAEAALNSFMECDKAAWDKTRAEVAALLSADCSEETQAKLKAAGGLVAMADAEMLLPARIGDYTDFYSSREHATNVGKMFRPGQAPLKPNWLHLPVGYHGRASSVVVSGTGVRRPNAQLQKDRADPLQGSIFGPCRLMDFELEMAFFVGGKENAMGTPIKMAEANDRIFGMVLMNDWSARDVQKWEYVPLGPFTGKNLGTTISPWVVPLAALEPFTCPTSYEKQDDPQPLPYLRDPNYSSYDIKLSVGIAPEGAKEDYVVTRSNYKHMYWNHRQQLVHHAVTGCNMRAGDLCGSGTISTGDKAENGTYGSMLELCWAGSREVQLTEGVTRKFLKDGDDVVMRGYCQGDGYKVGFGECRGKVLPAFKIDA